MFTHSLRTPAQFSSHTTDIARSFHRRTPRQSIHAAEDGFCSNRKIPIGNINRHSSSLVGYAEIINHLVVYMIMYLNVQELFFYTSIVACYVLTYRISNIVTPGREIKSKLQFTDNPTDLSLASLAAGYSRLSRA